MTSEANLITGLIVGVLAGLVIGSYLTCVAWRIPRRMSIMGRSICPACGVELKAHWNMPVLGWLLLKGRARCCGARIPARYPLIELTSAAAMGALGAAAGYQGPAIATALIIVLTAAISFSTVRPG